MFREKHKFIARVFIIKLRKMSKSVLKRCLELVEEDLPTSSSSKQTKTNPNKQKKKSTIFDMIPEQKRLTVTTKTGKNQIKRKIILLHDSKFTQR